MSDETTSIGVLFAACTRHPKRVAMRHPRGEWTYGELIDRVYRMARALRAQGLGRGDVVTLLTGNHADTIVLRYAANVLGCCASVLYDGLATSTLADIVRKTNASALAFAPDRYADQALAILDEVPDVAALTLGEFHCGVNISTLAEAEPAEPIRIEARTADLASIRFTGGSTGIPKGIPCDFRVPTATLTTGEDTTQLLCTPIGHVGGVLADIVLAAGGVVVLHERFDAGEVLAAIESQHVTLIWLLPNLLHQLLDHPALKSTDTSSLRLLILGGWASTPYRVAQAVERFGPIVTQAYGASEVGLVTRLTAEEHLRPELLTTVGRPIPDVEVTIRDPSGELVDTGVTGEIWVRGPDLITGYYKQPEETAKVLHDGWFHTGDLGFLDINGYLSIVGRSKDVIIIAGGHVYPSDIENVLLRHPCIQAAMVFGATEADNDERLCVAVVPTPTGHLSENDVARWVREQRGGLYQPNVVLILDELPTTGSQKPDRAALRRMVSGLRR
ncbi:MAG: AMP-binding protein [Pseudonocardiaceae bacterium]